MLWAVGGTFELGVVDDFLRHAGHFRHLQVAAFVTDNFGFLQVIVSVSSPSQNRQLIVLIRNSNK